MIFRQMLPGQKLILARIETKTPPPLSVIARSAPPTPPWLIRIVLWVVTCFAPLVAYWPPPIWTINKARFTILAIVFLAVIEVLAQNHVEKSLGLA